MRTMSQMLSPEKVAEFNEHCYGCDPQEFLEDIKDCITYQVQGKDSMLMSLLSDAQEAMSFGDQEGARKTINRVKFLIRELP